MDITGRGVDMRMTKQGLHDRKINTRFGKSRPESVPKCMGVPARDTSSRPVVAKDRAQTRRGQRLATGWSFATTNSRAQPRRPAARRAGRSE